MRWWSCAWAAVLLGAVPGCGDSEGGAGDGSVGFRDGGAPLLGRACDDAMVCPTGTACLEEETEEIGGADDRVRSLPDGGVGVSSVSYRDGYCGILGTAEDPFPCVPGRGQCGPYGTCVWRGDVTGCFRACDPAGEGNDVCREGYACAFEGACLPGCARDAECRIQRRDEDGDGLWEASDPLVYDTGSDARCDEASFRCTHSGTAGAEAGIRCAKDAECEADGVCRVFWPDGGYCTKLGCDVEGRACAGDGTVCQRNVFGVAACFQGCVVGAEAEALRLGPGGHGEGCRTGYMCFYDGAGEAGEVNGACIPGNYNDVTSPNVGAVCEGESECWSPHGAGICAEGGIFGDAGYCTVLGCGAPGIDGAEVCGPDARCVSLGEGETACLRSCASAEGCQPGHGCVDRDGDPATPRACVAWCETDLDCRAGQTCDPATFTCTG